MLINRIFLCCYLAVSNKMIIFAPSNNKTDFVMKTKASKNDYLKLGFIILVVIVGAIHINRLRSNINYVDFDCPKCGSNEVLDLGQDIDGMTRAKCADCGVEMKF